MVKVTVTGGCGFIGSHLVERLVDDGHQVTVADILQPGYGFLDNLKNKGTVAFRRVDLTGFQAAREAVGDSEWVFHLAGMSHIPLCRLHPLQAIESHYLATANVLEACRLNKTVRKIVFAGTDHIYSPANAEIDEQGGIAPIEIYGLVKAQSIQLCKLYHDMYKVPVSVLVSGNVFGERQDGSKVVPIFVKLALKGLPIVVNGGKQTRDFYHVSNLVNAYLLVADRGEPGESYNVSGEQEMSVATLANVIVALTGSLSKILIAGYRDDEDDGLRLHLNKDKIKQLRYEEIVGFDDGMRRTVEWFRKNL